MSQTTSGSGKSALFKDVEISFSPVQGAGSAVSLCPAGAAPVPALATVAQNLTETVRAPVTTTIRDVDNPDKDPRPYSGALHAADIDENRWAFKQAGQILKNVGCDVALGLQRGGHLLTETTLAGMDAPPNLVIVAKKNVKKKNGEMVRQMKALVKNGKKSLSMVDCNMGGSSYNWMKNQANELMRQLKDEGLDKGVTVTIVMISERFGNSKNDADAVHLKPDDLADGITSVFIPVRFVGGDDVDRVAGVNHRDKRPLGVFNDQGRYAPIPLDNEHGKTPREQFKKLMNPPKLAKK